MSELAQQFQQAVRALQQQQFDQAQQIAQKLNQQSPEHPDILHLLALASKQKAPEKAYEYFQRSLEINPKQPSVLSNFANFLQASQQLRGARQSYLKALQLNPDLLDAWYNLASLHYQSGDYLAASHAAAKALALKPDFLKAAILKSRAELDYKQFDKAAETLKTSLERWPDEPTLQFNDALLNRFTGRTADAQKIMEGLTGLIDEPQRQFQLGCLAYDQGQLQVARQHMEQAIELKNDLVPAHEALNKLFWEHGPQEQFLTSFTKALERQPDSLALAYSYLSHLLRAERRPQAQALLSQFIQRFGPVHSLLHLQGTELLRDGNIEQAAELFDRALQQQPRHPRYLIDKANVLLRQQRYDEAFQLLDRAHENQPLDQEVHAFKGLCWKLSGEAEKAAELNNYQSLVKVGMLPTPPGYESLQQFWPLLVKRIQQLHQTEHQPLDQSVRKGTQTVGSLLTIQDPVIQAYKQSLQQFIDDYLEQLPADSRHPVTARLSSGYHFSGSWSVKLFKEGFHTNHVHPQGWLSLCTYLSIPQQVHEDDTEQKGWIRFGQTSLDLGERETVDLAVCPKPGMCVIFPSYSWHGTVPFDSDEERLTIPCDIMPS
ncbi:tetratricopeptide repeat protein [Idiomarina seosinensis]|uniref:tetratricopeptide repeat protein n=1 Tax=Idiomarina seosinensis TaxID=281739 RepID=UPI00385160DF